MKVITYLGFTVLSIFIQFCVMDIIQEKIQQSQNPEDVNVTEKKIVENFLKNISSKPHALYYKKEIKSMKTPFASNQPIKSASSEKMYPNSSIPTTLLDTTEISTVIFDILDVENTSTTDTTSTMETIFTTTEIENNTEITFETTNKSLTPNTVKKTIVTNNCGCNLLYQVCDVNCCCDLDCTEEDRLQFQCERKENDNRRNKECIYHLFKNDKSTIGTFDSLFCVVKTNLPQSHDVKQPNLALMSQYNKWKRIARGKTLYEFKKRLYKNGDPIWLLKNGTIYYLDFATSNVNNYCTDRTPIILFKNENIQCLVNFNDLEMLHIANTEASVVISGTDKIINSSELNCSTALHCVNWTILVCQNGNCRNYNKSSDKVSCTDSSCINLALKIEYYFYYYDFKIINASIKLHIQDISNIYPFMLQVITVNFIMTNITNDRVIEFSGNPGYLSHLPIITSYAESNFTDDFFNSTSGSNHIFLPENQNGLCVSSNYSSNIISFGVNKRSKCRYVYPYPALTNTSICENIQADIYKKLRLNNNVFVSPFGNPYGIKDGDWIKLQNEIKKHEPTYGVYSQSLSKLHCYNLIDRVSFEFVFANVNKEDALNQNKILLAKCESTAINTSFFINDISIVLTIDIIFLDATKPGHPVYAGSPHLNINLPKDFFFPFPPNNFCIRISYSCAITIFCCALILITNKITHQ